MAATVYPQTVSEVLADVRTASLDWQLLAQIPIALIQFLPYLWHNTLTIPRRILVHRLLLGYHPSRGSPIPRRFQIEVALDSYEDHDS